MTEKLLTGTLSLNTTNQPTLDDALDIIQEFCYDISTSYTAPRVTKGFGEYDILGE